MASTHEPHKQFTIIIDRAEYKVTSETLTGAQIRLVRIPPIGQDLDLFLVTPGPGDDVLVADDQSVQIKNGMHFFTAPRTISPGH